MVRDKHKIISKRSQYTLAPLELRSSPTASHGYYSTPEEHDAGLKYHLVKIIETLKEDKNKQHKKNTENKVKKVKTLKDETNKSLKEIQENTKKCRY